MTLHDPLAAAIATASERRVQHSLRLSTGRLVAVSLPADLSDTELADLIAVISTSLRAQLRAANRPAGRLVIPRA